jgi:peptidoglycan-associated lipoprotein
MSAWIRLAKGAALLGVAACALACGGAKPPEAQAAATSSTSSAASTDRPAQAATKSNVSISDEIRAKCGIPDADAYFPFDSSRLTSNDHSPLDLVARCFTAGPLKGHSMKLVGRADPRGATDYNFTLGQGRADAVTTYLSTRGVERGKLQATSRGAMDASGTDESSWQRDRRVDVLLGN